MNFKEFVFYKNLSLKEIADALDVGVLYAGRILNGKTPVSPKIAKKIERITKGVVKHDNVFGPPSYPNLDAILKKDSIN
jgi:transcriptional regulator with XRE-family HTH domain